MKDRRLKVFLAHSSLDKAPVREIFNLLTADGFEPWLDEQSLLPGQEWELEIKKAVQKSDVVAVFVSKNSIERQGYVNKEILFALDIAERNPEGTIFIVPILLDYSLPPERLSHLHYIPLPFSDSDASLGATYMRLQLALISRAYQLGIIEDNEIARVGFPTFDIYEKLAGDWSLRYKTGGRYIVRGQNPNGSNYYGTASIVGTQNSLKMKTFIGAHVFNYKGKLTETGTSRMLIFKGKGYTVSYTDSRLGILTGKWGEGGIEELIPASHFADTPEGT